MTTNIPISKETLDATTPEEQAHVIKVLSDLKMFSPNAVFLPMPIDPMPPPTGPMGWPGDWIDGARDAVAGIPGKLGLCDVACEAAYSVAVAACTANTAGAGLVLCISAATVVRDKCKDSC